MRLFAVAGDTLGLFSTRLRIPPETFEHEGRTWRTTSYLPSLKRAEKPEPGTLPPTNDPEG